jgi:hypothetical protein
MGRAHPGGAPSSPRDDRAWQGRQESNPQPAVLETAALPIELRPYVAIDHLEVIENSSPSAASELPRFPMKLMRAASRTKLFQFHPARIVAPVLFRRVIPIVARRTLKRDGQPVSFRFLRHCTTSYDRVYA